MQSSFCAQDKPKLTLIKQAVNYNKKGTTLQTCQVTYSLNWVATDLSRTAENTLGYMPDNAN